MSCSIVNAGDGAHEHPTQALLDLLTIREKKGHFDGLSVAIVGDIAHSRVARSNIHGMRKLGMTVTVAGPPTLIPPYAQELGCKVAYRLEDAIRDVDVIMMLRLQQERMHAGLIPSLREYSRYWGLSLDKLRAHARPDVLIMHPGPVNRGVELSPEVADGPYSVILDQVAKGVAVRMGVLLLLAGSKNAEAA
jgi:aspartate carbamoyltransferase catalytic subunit